MGREIIRAKQIGDRISVHVAEDASLQRYVGNGLVGEDGDLTTDVRVLSGDTPDNVVTEPTLTRAWTNEIGSRDNWVIHKFIFGAVPGTPQDMDNIRRRITQELDKPLIKAVDLPILGEEI